MPICYEAVPAENAACVRELCNELMAYQKSMATVRPDLFDAMCFETRMLPSIQSAKANHIIVARDGDEIAGYVYCNVSSKETYANAFATFFDMDSVKNDDVGCLSQFYIREGYRNSGIGTQLFNMSMDWLKSIPAISDLFIFVSNGNDGALSFYLRKGFRISHQILDGFITVLRNS